MREYNIWSARTIPGLSFNSHGEHETLGDAGEIN